MGFHISLNSFMSDTYFSNTGQQYLIALAVLVGLFIILTFFKLYIVSVLKKISQKTKTELDDAFVTFIDDIGTSFYFFIALYFSLRSLILPKFVDKIIYYLLVIVVIYYLTKASMRIIDYITNTTVEKRRVVDKREDTSFIIVLGKISKGVVLLLAGLLLITNLGIDITPLIAGMGIGGIAVAFALQNILGDLFSSFSIYFDKPFKEGDYIVIGADSGVVQHIGLKSTRVKTLQGQELVVSNKELTSTRVNNYKKMKKRRVAVVIGVEYGTPTAKMKKGIDLVRDVFKKVGKDAELDRVHFKEFGPYSLNYELVYYVNSGDYAQYMDINQVVNFAIKDAFEKQKISMAFPTQTVFVKK